jgi:hypothetical protein
MNLTNLKTFVAGASLLDCAGGGIGHAARVRRMDASLSLDAGTDNDVRWPRRGEARGDRGTRNCDRVAVDGRGRAQRAAAGPIKSCVSVAGSRCPPRRSSTEAPRRCLHRHAAHVCRHVSWIHVVDGALVASDLATATFPSPLCCHRTPISRIRRSPPTRHRVPAVSVRAPHGRCSVRPVSCSRSRSVCLRHEVAPSPL